MLCVHCEELVREDATATAQILRSPHCWYPHTMLQFLKMGSRCLYRISLGDDPVPSNFVGFRGLATLLPHFCQLSVPEVGVCGVYPESP